jgi:uncharacterized membrane protein YphA (DoxX/SURF4 family)
MGGCLGLAALKRLRWDTSIPALAVLLTEAQTAVRFLFAGEYKVPVLPPEFAALLATTFEWSCSTLLALGLATRVATLALLGMVAIIQTFVYPSAWAEHLTWGSILLFLRTRGGGPSHWIGSSDWSQRIQTRDARSHRDETRRQPDASGAV